MSRDLKGMRAKIQQHKQDFKAMTDTAMQKRLQEVHEHTSALSGATTHSNGPNTVELPIDTVTLPRNEGFVGREEELHTLHKFLVDERSSAGVVSCIVHGVGGYGKTQVALEYSYKYKEDYNAIFWVEAENNFVLLRSFGAIGRALKLFETEDIKQPEIEKTMAWLKTTGNVLPFSYRVDCD
jgi:hypothetical protein